SSRAVPAGAGRFASAALLVFALMIPAAALAEGEEGRVTVRGRITDETGEGVAGQVVRLLKSRTYVKITGLRQLDQIVEDARASTDALGFYEFEYRPDPAFPYYYLRFYDPRTFDAVKYRLPDDREISKRVRSGRPVEISVSLKFQPDWPKVKALLDSYSPGSQVGQVLRSLGLPSSRAQGGPGPRARRALPAARASRDPEPGGRQARARGGRVPPSPALGGRCHRRARPLHRRRRRQEGASHPDAPVGPALRLRGRSRRDVRLG